MAWRGSTRAATRAHILTVAAFLGLFGFSPGTAEQTEREEWFGSVDCPATLFLRWNEYLSRPPYVEKEPNSTGVFSGLFRGNASAHLDDLGFEICVFLHPSASTNHELNINVTP